MASVVALTGLAIGDLGPSWGYLRVAVPALNLLQRTFTGSGPLASNNPGSGDSARTGQDPARAGGGNRAAGTGGDP